MLVDAGPLIAMLDVDDPAHRACLAVGDRPESEPLLTTWPCFTEAMYMLGTAGGHRLQAKLWQLRSANRLQLLALTAAETDRAEELMAKYTDTPMDLADATLVAVAETRSFSKVFTLDSDFRVYRLRGGAFLEMVP